VAIQVERPTGGPSLDPTFPTLAEYLSAPRVPDRRVSSPTPTGAAMSRRWIEGFSHYEDYPLTPRNRPGKLGAGPLAGRAHAAHRGTITVVKWIRVAVSRRPGGSIAPFAELACRSTPSRTGPFFAFLNYLDAHEPFVPPDEPGASVRPRARVGPPISGCFWTIGIGTRLPHLPSGRGRWRADSYEPVASPRFDRQIGALLDELERRGVLRETLVIITSDHGRGVRRARRLQPRIQPVRS